MIKLNFLRSLFIIPLAFGLVACESVSTTSGGAIGVERQQKMLTLLSEEQVNSMSEEAYNNVLEEARKERTLNQDTKQLTRLRAIADRLVAQTSVYRSDAMNWNWEVNLLSSDQLNASCMPGGKIVFYTGIINQLKLTDDEIAAIMGHEMAHALREHGREAMSKAYAVHFGKGILGVIFGVNANAIELADTVVNYAMTLPNSRTNEVEADLIGLELMARAGYNPEAAVSLWQKMSEHSEGQPAEFASTHPSHEHRIDGLQATIGKVDHFYRKSQRPKP